MVVNVLMYHKLVNNVYSKSKYFFIVKSNNITLNSAFFLMWCTSKSIMDSFQIVIHVSEPPQNQIVLGISAVINALEFSSFEISTMKIHEELNQGFL